MHIQFLGATGTVTGGARAASSEDLRVRSAQYHHFRRAGLPAGTRGAAMVAGADSIMEVTQ